MKWIVVGVLIFLVGTVMSLEAHRLFLLFR